MEKIKIFSLGGLDETGKNTYVVAIYGNFDDAQTGVKRIFKSYL